MVVGRIVAAHGLRGQVRVEPATDFYGRFAKGSRLLLNGGWVTVESFSVHKDRPLLKLSGIDSMTAAESLKWAELSVADDTPPPLDEGEYLISDLVGRPALLPDGSVLGTVDEVLTSPAHDILRIGETLIPFIEQFVRVEPDAVHLTPIPGMLPGEE